VFTRYSLKNGLTAAQSADFVRSVDVQGSGHYTCPDPNFFNTDEVTQAYPNFCRRGAGPGGRFCTAISSLAQATDTAELQVSGTIITSACTPTLSTAVIGLGDIKYADLEVDGSTVLPTKLFTYTVTCDTPMSAATTAKNNEASSRIKEDGGLGFAADGVTKLGNNDIVPGPGDGNTYAGAVVLDRTTGDVVTRTPDDPE
jgi:hypothetical protein